MLDTETKRRIDTARDILVGKVPDPKSQVEQITIALIYKFMDDMDKEAVELGGKASFFTGEYKKYSWTNIFSPKISGFDMITLYGEAIEKLNINPKIPQLFRDIFKNAYLPYRDPETLKLFLKTINEFTYDHSEKLGDAFEYLLSVLGTQGDAGQFRTPRHIIDFIVQCVEPKKNETICDPACGTAGFIISAYKYIMQQNTVKSRGDKLTPDDRKKLAKNFAGFDIDPNMVRLALANMYLHGFASPNIHEYDTLTSEERWNEQYDVILANPPFMTPKGGIKPHKRFSVQANRSEVLFVDYIAEHINPTTGRAGVIVPEGIIFQSAGAYKQLRKMLVDKKYLYAIVSLPAGIFQPYSGVKTSILLMDRALARKTDNILFVKIDNDGFDLGAQRRANDKNDLAGCLELIQQYKHSLQNNLPFESDNKNVFVVERKRIAEKEEYNLSVDRYRINENVQQSHFEMVQLGDVCDIYNGATPLRSKNEYWENGNINWFTIDDIREQGRVIRDTKQKITELGFENTSVKLLPKSTVLLCCTASVGEYAFTEIELTTNQQFNGLVVKKEFQDRLLPKYLFILSSTFKDELIRLSGKTSFNFVSVGTLKTIEIPLPPLSIQQQIVSKIESYQKIIDGAKQVVDNCKPQIEIEESWERVLLGDEIDFVSGVTLSIPDCEDVNGIPIISMADITEEGQITTHKIRKVKIKKGKYYTLQKGDLLFNWRNGSKQLVGKTGYFDLEGEYVFASFCLGIRAKENYLPKFLWYLLNQYRRDGLYFDFMRQNINGLFNREELKILEVPLPPLSTQQSIVQRIEQEQQLVNANKELIKIFEQKIKDEIGKLWEKEGKEYKVEEGVSLAAE